MPVFFCHHLSVIEMLICYPDWKIMRDHLKFTKFSSFHIPAMPAKTTSNPPQPGNRYLNYVLFMLTLVYIFNFVDRQLLVILQESIKKELKLSDTQLGLLSGFTFAIFYVTLGIPIARFADKHNRRNIVAGSLGLWSIMQHN